MSNPWRVSLAASAAISLTLLGCQVTQEQECPVASGSLASECKQESDEEWHDRAAEEAEQQFDQRGPGPF